MKQLFLIVALLGFQAVALADGVDPDIYKDAHLRINPDGSVLLSKAQAEALDRNLGTVRIECLATSAAAIALRKENQLLKTIIDQLKNGEKVGL